MLGHFPPSPNFSAKALRAFAQLLPPWIWLSQISSLTPTPRFNMTGAPSLLCFSTLCVLWLFQTCCIFTDISPRIFFTINSFCSLRLQKMEKWECFQRSRAVPTLWEEREREQVLPTQPPGWCPALGLRLRSSTPRGRSSVQTVSFSESYPKVFNNLASFIEGGNPSVTTLGHTKDNHSPEQSFYQLCRGIQNYTRCFNFELPSCCLCDDIDHILSVWRDVAGPVTLHGLIDQSSNSVCQDANSAGMVSTCSTTPSIGGPRKCLMVEVVIDGNILIKVCDHLRCW